jgi:hypothetical protein
LAPSTVRRTTSIFLQVNICFHSPYVTSYLTRGWIFVYNYCWPLASAVILMSESRGIRDWTLAVIGPYVTSSLRRRWGCLLWICLLLKILPFALYKSSVGPGFAKQITPILRILCYNCSLVAWTVVDLTTAKFKPLIFSMPSFTLSYTTNMFILMICMTSACYLHNFIF